MFRSRRLLISTTLVALLALLVTTSAFAHLCTNPNKPTGAGSIGTYNILTGEFVPGPHFNAYNMNHVNGGFVTITDGASFTVDVFANTLLPEGALDAGPGDDNYCDGIGIDLFLACIGAVEG